MIPRHLERKIRQAAEQYPVISLTEPRQSGKTTLIRAMFPDMQYFSLEDPELRHLAVEDPRGFLAQFRETGWALISTVHSLSLSRFLPGRCLQWTAIGAMPNWVRFLAPTELLKTWCIVEGCVRGKNVLVAGAPGGVGSAVVQLVKGRGATVTAISAKTKMEQVLSIGANRVIDRDNEISGKIVSKK